MREKAKQSEIKRIILASKYSIQGFKNCYKLEAAFRIELLLTVLFLPLGYFLGDSAIEKALLIAPIFIVLITEMLNSAIEAVVDRISTKENELSGLAKDIASAAVALSFILFILTWAIILL